MASAFSRLPLEILLDILQNVPDLPSLYKFICASARANEAFEFDPAPVLEKAIARSIPHFKHLAHMVAIMGSMNLGVGTDLRPSLQFNFSSLVDRFRSLPEDVLSTAAPSYAFATNTPGPRYLLLTAYRIEQLSHICFVTLLQNIHELIFPRSEHTPSSRISRPGVFFAPAAWWSPSWDEKLRVEQALWKLFIHWTTRMIPNELTEDPTFRHYSKLMSSINPEIAPKMRDGVNSHEVEEMNCISAAIYELLGWSPFVFFAMLPGQTRKAYIRKASSRLSSVLEETSHWKFEEPEPSWDRLFEGWHPDSKTVSVSNDMFRNFYWSTWEYCARQSNFEFDNNGCLFPDYLGLCLWDTYRLYYLGLDYDRCPFSDYAAKPGFSTATPLFLRWRDVFLEELLRLPGGLRRPVYRDFKKQICCWQREIATSSLCFGTRLDAPQNVKTLSQILASHEYDSHTESNLGIQGISMGNMSK